MDEFWIEPLTIDGNSATICGGYSEFTVTLLIARKDGSPLAKEEARVACDAVVSRLPQNASSR